MFLWYILVAAVPKLIFCDSNFQAGKTSTQFDEELRKYIFALSRFVRDILFFSWHGNTSLMVGKDFWVLDIGNMIFLITHEWTSVGLSWQEYVYVHIVISASTTKGQ